MKTNKIHTSRSLQALQNRTWNILYIIFIIFMVFLQILKHTFGKNLLHIRNIVINVLFLLPILFHALSVTCSSDILSQPEILDWHLECEEIFFQSEALSPTRFMNCCCLNSDRSRGMQWGINLELPVLVPSLKSSNVEHGANNLNVKNAASQTGKHTASTAASKKTSF